MANLRMLIRRATRSRCWCHVTRAWISILVRARFRDPLPVHCYEGNGFVPSQQHGPPWSTTVSHESNCHWKHLADVPNHKFVSCFFRRRKIHFLFAAALSCVQRLLALHPLNPELWIQFAEISRQMSPHSGQSDPVAERLSFTKVSDSSKSPSDDKGPPLQDTGDSLVDKTHIAEGTASHEKKLATEETCEQQVVPEPFSRRSLYNPEYPCRSCTRKNCSRFCIHSDKILDIRTRTERCSDDCPDVERAPEVCLDFLSRDGCKCSRFMNGSGMWPGHGCTTLVHTAHSSHEAHRSTNESQKQTDNNDLCAEVVNASERLKSIDVRDDNCCDTRGSVAIALVRAR